MQTVHVRINDAATGQPTPVRIQFTDGAGNYYAPFGRLTQFATGINQDVGGNVRIGDKADCYIDGTCEIALPTGPILIEAHKGPEYRPLVQQVELAPGKLALRLSISRWSDLRAEGWYAGDMRCHFLCPHAALLEGAAEDLAVVNLLAIPWREAEDRPWSIPNLLAFSGQRPALEMPGHMVVVNTLNVAHDQARLSLLNCHRVVYPLSFGGPNEPSDWTLEAWCDQCHRKGGLVVWTDIESASEAALDAVDLSRIDAVEVTDLNWCERSLEQWYRLLSGGRRLPLTGASGKASNATLLGAVRTYARLEPGQDFNYRNWIEAVRAGRTFVTNGPLLSFSVNGQEPGSIVAVPAGTTTVRVGAVARSLLPFDRLEVIADGAVVASASPQGDAVVIEDDLPVSSSGWWAARCWGRGVELGETSEAWQAAHTSPVYVVFS